MSDSSPQEKIDRRLEESARRLDDAAELLGDAHSFTGVEGRMARIRERLQKIEEVRAQECYYVEQTERARRVELGNKLDQVEARLKQELERLQEYRSQIQNIVRVEKELKKLLENGKIPLDRRVERINHFSGQVSEAEKKAQKTRETIEELRTGEASRNEMEVAQVVAPCPRAVSQQGIFPLPGDDLKQMCDAVLEALEGFTDPNPLSTGRSIGVAKLADGSFLISSSGNEQEAAQVIDWIRGHLQTDKAVAYATTKVPNLELRPPLKDDVVMPPGRECAMPKLWYTAREQLNQQVTAVTEVWSGPENPYPVEDDSKYMIPCHFCAWNAEDIKSGAAWHR